MKILLLYIVSIHRDFYKNWLINECARKKKAKNPVITESWSEIQKNLRA